MYYLRADDLHAFTALQYGLPLLVTISSPSRKLSPSYRTNDPVQEQTNKMNCVPTEVSDQRIMNY